MEDQGPVLLGKAGSSPSNSTTLKNVSMERKAGGKLMTFRSLLAQMIKPCVYVFSINVLGPGDWAVAFVVLSCPQYTRKSSF